VWHHAVLNEHSASAGALWVDGVLQGSSETLAAVTNSVELVIGYIAHSDGFQQKYWSGKIDELRIYHRVLSAAEITQLFVEGESPPPDQDDDGIPDTEDTCPASDLSVTVVIDHCASGVPNTWLPNGCTISDLSAERADGASDHGQFVSCVAHVTNDLKKAGTITGLQKGAIQSCAAQAAMP
jgi:concanavalin A-like lectin/glucanase superfamily protein